MDAAARRARYSFEGPSRCSIGLAPSRAGKPGNRRRGSSSTSRSRPEASHGASTLSGAGCEHVLPGQRYSPSGHPKLYHQEWETGGALPEFQAIYVTRGAGVFESAHGGKHEIAAGDLIFAFPGVWHRYRPTLEVGWDEYWISANGEMLHRLLREGFLSPSDPVLKVGLNEDLVAPTGIFSATCKPRRRPTLTSWRRTRWRLSARSWRRRPTRRRMPALTLNERRTSSRTD